MPRLVNAYTVAPQDIEAGDAMLFIVKALVVRPGLYRLYRCRADDQEKIPQGARIFKHEEEVCEALFPSLAAVAKPDRG